MNKQRGLKLFALFAFISILLIFSSVIISAQNPSDKNSLRKDISFNYDDNQYYYNTANNEYQTSDGTKSFSEVPYGAKEIKGFVEGFKAEPGFFNGIINSASNYLDKYRITRNIFGIGEEKNIIQRTISILGYGNDNVKLDLPPLTRGICAGIIFLTILTVLFMKTREGNKGIIISIIAASGGAYIFYNYVNYAAGLILGLVSVGIAAFVCGGLLKLLDMLIPYELENEIIEKIKEGIILPTVRKAFLKFVGLYALIIGVVYILINIPVVSILKPLLWPLTTDFGLSFAQIFDSFNKIGYGLGVYLLRGITMGLFSFLVFIVIIIITHGHSIILKIIAKYNEERDRMRRQRAVDDSLAAFEAHRAEGARMRQQR